MLTFSTGFRWSARLFSMESVFLPSARLLSTELAFTSPALYFLKQNCQVQSARASPKTVANEFFYSCMAPFFFPFYSSGNGGERGSEPQVAKFIDNTSGSHPMPLYLQGPPPCTGWHQYFPHALLGFHSFLDKPLSL